LPNRKVVIIMSVSQLQTKGYSGQEMRRDAVIKTKDGGKSGGLCGGLECGGECWGGCGLCAGGTVWDLIRESQISEISERD